MIRTERSTNSTESEQPQLTLLDEALQQTIDQTQARVNNEAATRSRNNKPAPRDVTTEDAKIPERISRLVDKAIENVALFNERLAALEAVANKMADDVYFKLPVSILGKPTAADERTQREHLAEVCRESSEFLRGRCDVWQAWLQRIISENVDYEEERSEAHTTSSEDSGDQFDNQEDARVTDRAAKQREIAENLAAKVVQHMELSAFVFKVQPWLNHERLERKNIVELYDEAPAAFRRMAKDVVVALFRCLLTAQSKQIYGDIDVGRISVEYSFVTHSIVAKTDSELTYRNDVHYDHDIYSEVVSKTEGTRTTSHVLHEHVLMDPLFYDHEATLGNPTLEIPPHFRAILEATPEEFKPYITSVFGTQITERSTARAIETEKVFEERVISRTRQSDELATEDPEWEEQNQTFLRWEPCVVFASQIVLFGWGSRLMNDTKNIYDQHAQILGEERKLLAEAHRAHGSYSTNLRWGLGLIALAVADLIFAIGIRSFAAAVVVLPILFYAGLAVSVTQREMRMKWKNTLLKAEKTIQDGFRSLTEKYPAFDPHQPRVSPPNDADEQSS